MNNRIIAITDYYEGIKTWCCSKCSFTEYGNMIPKNCPNCKSEFINSNYYTTHLKPHSSQ